MTQALPQGFDVHLGLRFIDVLLPLRGTGEKEVSEENRAILNSSPKGVWRHIVILERNQESGIADCSRATFRFCKKNITTKIDVPAAAMRTLAYSHSTGAISNAARAPGRTRTRHGKRKNHSAARPIQP